MDNGAHIRDQTASARSVIGALRKIVFWFLLCISLWLGGLLWFINQMPTEATRDETPADAIVVLTGGSNRLEHGLQLLVENKGKKVFISGVHDASTPSGLLRHVSSAELRAKLQALPQEMMVLGHDAENTIGNADETARWLKKEGHRTIRLVTSNYHMPRSLLEFRNTVPNIAIIADPVFPEDFKLGTWWLDTPSRHLVFREYHKYLAAKLRHWIVSITLES